MPKKKGGRLTILVRFSCQRKRKKGRRRKIYTDLPLLAGKKRKGKKKGVAAASLSANKSMTEEKESRTGKPALSFIRRGEKGKKAVDYLA